MYTKTRSTLAGLTAASLFVLCGWVFGRPVVQPVPTAHAPMVSITIASDAPSELFSDAPSELPSQPTSANGRSARMSLAMPYFSFALLRTRKGIN